MKTDYIQSSRKWRYSKGLLLSLLLGSSFPGTARATSVSLELMMLVDSSGSIVSSEWEFQRDSIAAAFRNPSVNTLFTSGNSVAVSLYYWAGDAGSGLGVHEEGVPWTQISSAADALAFADLVDLTSRPDISTTPLAQTAISRAINQSVPLFMGNGFEGLRNLIDVSGDGMENVDATQAWNPSPLPTVSVDLTSVNPGLGVIDVPIGPNYNWGIPQDARNAAIEAGIGINGLVLLDGLEDSMALVTDTFRAPTYSFGGLTLEEEAAAQALIDSGVSDYLQANHDGERMIEFFYDNAIIGSPPGDPEAQLFIAEDNAAFADAIALKLASEIIPEPTVFGLLLVSGSLSLARRRRDP